MTTPDFWMKATIAGGGLSVFGDFAYSTLTGDNMAERNLLQIVAGPVFGGIGGDVSRVLNSAIGKIQNEKDAEEVMQSFFGDLVNKGSRYIPMSSIWYLKTAFRNGLIGQLEQTVNPDSANRMERYMDRVYDERGQEFFWKPNEATPSRFPTPFE